LLGGDEMTIFYNTEDLNNSLEKPEVRISIPGTTPLGTDSVRVYASLVSTNIKPIKWFKILYFQDPECTSEFNGSNHPVIYDDLKIKYTIKRTNNSGEAEVSPKDVIEEHWLPMYFSSDVDPETGEPVPSVTTWGHITPGTLCTTSLFDDALIKNNDQTLDPKRHVWLMFELPSSSSLFSDQGAGDVYVKVLCSKIQTSVADPSTIEDFIDYQIAWTGEFSKVGKLSIDNLGQVTFTWYVP
jgi:hypothetical protein